MAKLDFSAYLGVKVDDIEAPKPLPLGHYYATFKSWKGAERDYDKANGGPKTPVVELTFSLDEPCDDVEPEELPDKGVNGRIVTKDYQLNDEIGLNGLKLFTSKACGVDTKGLDLGDALDACLSSTVKLFNEPRPGKEEGQFFPNIRRILDASE